MYTSKMVKILIKEEEKIIAFIIESENFVEITILPAFKKEIDDEVEDLLPATYKFGNHDGQKNPNQPNFSHIANRKFSNFFGL